MKNNFNLQKLRKNILPFIHNIEIWLYYGEDALLTKHIVKEDGYDFRRKTRDKCFGNR